MKKLKYIIPAFLILVLAIGFTLSRGSRTSDEDQIRALIEGGRQAIEKKSVSRAFSCVSKDYSDEAGLNYDRLRMLVSNAFSAETAYQVAVDAPETQVAGDLAAAHTHVTLSAANGDSQPIFSGDVVIHLRKESGRRYFIFPVRTWKVTAIEGIKGIPDLNL